jgi:hypothetical protein
MTELLKNNTKFEWSEACEKSFQELKRRLTTVPMLTLPVFKKDFVVYCDTSRQGLGCILMQEGKVVAYASRSSRNTRKTTRHTTWSWQLLCTHSKIWRHYLMGNKCELYTDHKSLKYFFT